MIIIKCIKLFNLPRNNADPGQAAAQLSECRAGGRGNQTTPSGPPPPPAAPYLRTATRRRPAAAAPPAARSSVPAASPRIHAGAAARSPASRRPLRAIRGGEGPPGTTFPSATGQNPPAGGAAGGPARAGAGGGQCREGRPRTAPLRTAEGSAAGPRVGLVPGSARRCASASLRSALGQTAPRTPARLGGRTALRIVQVGKHRHGHEVQAPLLHHPVIQAVLRASEKFSYRPHKLSRMPQTAGEIFTPCASSVPKGTIRSQSHCKRSQGNSNRATGTGCTLSL